MTCHVAVTTPEPGFGATSYPNNLPPALFGRGPGPCDELRFWKGHHHGACRCLRNVDGASSGVERYSKGPARALGSQSSPESHTSRPGSTSLGVSESLRAARASPQPGGDHWTLRL